MAGSGAAKQATTYKSCRKAEPFFSKKIAISRRIEIFRGAHYTEFLNLLNTRALPGFLRAGVSKKRSRTAGPLPVYRSTGLGAVVKAEGRALAAHGPPHFSHAAPARKEEGRA